MTRSSKLFAGAKVRAIREQAGATQSAFAQRLGISTAYLNQIENNQRPLSAQVLVALTSVFGVDVKLFSSENADRLLLEAREVLSDPIFGGDQPGAQELRAAVATAPKLVQALLTIHRAFNAVNERRLAVADALATGQIAGAETVFPYEEVRDFFLATNNYVDELDRAAEELAHAAPSDLPLVDRLSAWLAHRHGIAVAFTSGTAPDAPLRAYEPATRRVTIAADLSPPATAFALAAQIALIDHAGVIDRLVEAAAFQTAAAPDICRLALANYFAGAVILPYRPFLEAARSLRHDVERLCTRFGASLEQVCHRLSTLQRPGEQGVPFYFLKVDAAGNIIKRHSATRFQFARFGGACPLWNVHEAFAAPDRFLVQLAEMPDGLRYLSIARGITKPGGAFGAPTRRYAIGVGCEAAYAKEVVYAEGIDIRSQLAVARVGVSCRTCERDDCLQRAVPPIDRRLVVDPNRRTLVPFRIV